jgi:hypothetical protein
MVDEWITDGWIDEWMDDHWLINRWIDEWMWMMGVG